MSKMYQKNVQNDVWAKCYYLCRKYIRNHNLQLSSNDYSRPIYYLIKHSCRISSLLVLVYFQLHAVTCLGYRASAARRPSLQKFWLVACSVARIVACVNLTTTSSSDLGPRTLGPRTPIHCLFSIMLGLAQLAGFGGGIKLEGARVAHVL